MAFQNVISVLIKGKDKASPEFKKAQGAMAGFQGAAKSFASFMMSPIGMTAAVTGAAYALDNLIDGVADAADEIAKTARKINIGTDALQQYRYHAELARVDSGTLDKSIAILGRNIFDVAQGVGEDATRGFEALGISVLDAGGNAKSTEAVFLEVADAIRDMGPASDEARAALQKIMGRSGGQLFTFFEAGAEGIKASGDELERLGGIIGGDTLTAAEEFADAQTRLSASFEGMKIALVGPLLDNLTTFIDKITDGVAAMRGMNEQVQQFGTMQGDDLFPVVVTPDMPRRTPSYFSGPQLPQSVSDFRSISAGATFTPDTFAMVAPAIDDTIDGLTQFEKVLLRVGPEGMEKFQAEIDALSATVAVETQRSFVDASRYADGLGDALLRVTGNTDEFSQALKRTVVELVRMAQASAQGGTVDPSGLLFSAFSFLPAR